MSPAVTRASALPRSSDSEGDGSTSSSAQRQPFVPKRKERKPERYTYLEPTQRRASADSLLDLAAQQFQAQQQQRQSSLETPISSVAATVRDLPPRPQSAWGAPPLARATQTPQSKPIRIAQTVTKPVSNEPLSAITAPILKPKASVPTVPMRNSTVAPTISGTPNAYQHPNSARPRSQTPTPMSSAPKIKAAVSADVAARIRSPRKQASSPALRTSAPSVSANASSSSRMSTNTHASSQRPTSMLRQQTSFVSSPLAPSSRHEVFDCFPPEHVSNEDADVGDSSFVYDGVSNHGMSSNGTDEQDTVKVHIRLRPPKVGEDCAWIANPYSGSVALESGLAASRVQSANLGPFAFDGVQTGSANRSVYISVARPLVRSALDGYDAVVFAYGQTASGKTFTLSGDEKGQEPGIIPRAVRDIFRGIKQSSARREYLLRASYLEIWNEVVKDLLEPSNVPQVRDDRRRGGKGTTVQPLREEIVTSAAQVKELLARGQANRHVGATDWNERSSRSHTCFKVTIESWDRGLTSDWDQSPSPTSSAAAVDPVDARLGKKVTVSELCLIDLAGSERYVSQGSDRRAEGAHINKSLLTLGKVIFALSDKASRTLSGGSASVTASHIPYRDSKLTRILQNSLSGHARVAVVCTLNPNPSAVDESLSTLNFAKRIKKVSLNARRNEVDSGMGGLGAEAQALILRYQNEASALRQMVEDLQTSSGRSPNAQQVTVLDDERIRELQERLDLIGSLVVRGGRGSADNEALGGITSQAFEDEDEDDDVLTPGTGLSPSVSGSSVIANSRSTSASSASTAGRTGNVARPVSPIKRSTASYLFGFDDPPHILAEKLFAANKKIEALSKKLAARPSLSGTSRDQADLIARQAQQIRELEAVCEAQAQDAPPKIREDVEREFNSRLSQLRQQVAQKDDFLATLQLEGDRLRRVNAQLMQLAHQQTADMVENLSSPMRTQLYPSSPLTNGPATPNSALQNSTNTPLSRRQAQLRNANLTPKPRPMSLYNSSSFGANQSTPFSTNAARDSISKVSVALDQSIPRNTNIADKRLREQRRSISNDYTLLQRGLNDLEAEMSSKLTPSDTFANIAHFLS